MTKVDYSKKSDWKKSEKYRAQGAADQFYLSSPTSDYILGSEYLGNSFSDRIFSNWFLFSSRFKNSTPVVPFLSLEKLILILYDFLSVVYENSNFAKRDDIAPIIFDKDDDEDLSMTWKAGTSLLIATIGHSVFTWTLQKSLTGSLVDIRLVTGSIDDFNDSILLLIRELQGILN